MLEVTKTVFNISCNAYQKKNAAFQKDQINHQHFKLQNNTNNKIHYSIYTKQTHSFNTQHFNQNTLPTKQQCTIQKNTNNILTLTILLFSNQHFKT